MKTCSCRLWLSPMSIAFLKGTGWPTVFFKLGFYCTTAVGSLGCLRFWTGLCWEHSHFGFLSVRRRGLLCCQSSSTSVSCSFVLFLCCRCCAASLSCFGTTPMSALIGWSFSTSLQPAWISGVAKSQLRVH